MSSVQPTNWLFRVGDATHLWSSSIFNIWGINSSIADSKFFLRKVKPGDCLWFVKGNSKGLLVAVAIFESTVKRVNGECMPFEQLGWVNAPGTWDTDIHFKKFKKIENLKLLTQIKSPMVVREYHQKCFINLPEMYSQIYPQEVQPESVRVRRITIEGIQYFKAANGDVYDPKTHDFLGTYINDVFTRHEETDDEVEETDDEAEESESLGNILSACLKSIDEMTVLNLLLNSRLANL